MRSILYVPMAEPLPTERLRLTPRSAVLAVAMFGTTLALLRVIAASQRVLGWMLVAAAAAGLLHPLVTRVERRLPHGLAVAVVFVGAVVCLGVIAYGTVDGVVREMRHLQEVAPREAARLEREGPLREAAHDAHLADRVEHLVEDIPERLRGGTPGEAVRAAATRAVAFLATGVLTLFLLLHGPRIAKAGLHQIHDRRRRARVEQVAVRVFHRGFGYARGAIAMSALAGLLGYAVASMADVPGPAPLGLWVAMWDLVPVVGAVIGALPIVLLAAASSPEQALLLAVLFLAYEAFETFVLQRWVERRSVRVGPFLTVGAGVVGLELYGIGGALVMLLLVTLAVATAEELAPG
ncbi:MAG TPA: AI-2E family transporter [Acidimicrobiales bacterium]|nr:AI-2E family transporter [Acidimicrobiales bacterium]